MTCAITRVAEQGAQREAVDSGAALFARAAEHANISAAQVLEPTAWRARCRHRDAAQGGIPPANTHGKPAALRTFWPVTPVCI